MGGGFLVGLGACVIGNPSYDGGASMAASSATTGSMSGSSSSASGSVGTLEITQGSISVSGGMTGGQTTGTTTETTTEATTEATTETTTGTGTTTGTTTDGAEVAFCTENLDKAAEALETNDCESVPFLSETIFFCRAELSWEGSKSVCEELCGRQVIAKSNEKRLNLYNAITAVQDSPNIGRDQPSVPTASLWVGAYGSNGFMGEYKWVNNDDMLATPNMNGWGPEDPDSDVPAGVVIGLYGKGPDNGEWFDRDLNWTYVFACESNSALVE